MDHSELLHQFSRLSLNDLNLSSILNEKLSLEQNDALRYFLFDTFFCAPSYDQACVQFLLALSVLARVQASESLADLWPTVAGTYGANFDIFFNKNLSRVFESHSDKNLLRNYETLLS